VKKLFDEIDVKGTGRITNKNFMEFYKKIGHEKT